MQTAQVTKTDDLNYKDGFVKCACGYEKTLGNGFNGYHIANCPQCTPDLHLRRQNTVTTGSKGNYTVRHGAFEYFVLSNGIHVQYSARVVQTIHKSRL